MKTILRVRNVIKEWNGTTLFENVSMDVTEGERLALFGRNGAGKTTLLRILLGDEAPTSGQVEHDLPLEERGWLKQQDTVNLSRTTLEAAQQASPLVRCTATRLLDMKPGGGYEIYEGTADEKQEDERSRQREPEDQEQREERLRLQLRLTELMGLTGMMDENDEHLSEIRHIRAKLDRLDFPGIHKNEV
ncbi:ATP-binding cassette domain-containing protein [Paenibacillus sp. Aloe-11]|uniref:ATP-binding cassette domain-containing protein n=1 Tax=Paenibacillus sp. Aloe-11 TaxID=1050222 RepID=UPI001E62CF6B|nr:ATP-binding cassette domain-containing protein [Paenibacillus sp. Aloe-11]